MNALLIHDSRREALCQLVAQAFAEIRALGWGNRGPQIADLADAFHAFLTSAGGDGLWDLDKFRQALVEYQSEHYKNGGKGFDFVASLRDMMPETELASSPC